MWNLLKVAEARIEEVVENIYRVANYYEYGEDIDDIVSHLDLLCLFCFEYDYIWIWYAALTSSAFTISKIGNYGPLLCSGWEDYYSEVDDYLEDANITVVTIMAVSIFITGCVLLIRIKRNYPKLHK